MVKSRLMAVRAKGPDKVLFLLLLTLVVGGFFIFLSASMGLLAKGTVSFTSIAFNQFFLGIVLGSLAAYIMSRIDYHVWRRYVWALFFIGIAGTFLVFIPGIGMHWGGAARWIHFGPVTFQPAELLKIVTIIFAAHIAAGQVKVFERQHWRSLLMLGATIAAVAVPMLLQPDTDTFLVIAAAATTIYFAAGLSWRNIGIIVFVALSLITALALTRPYVLARMTTFIHPEADAQGAGWQVQQSLIAIGSGGLVGRGFGQSVQKFNYLPEPIGDSIFAVFAEEFGFVGSVILVLLVAALIMRLLYLATRVKDLFGALILIGTAVTIGVQSFLNIAAMLAVVPLGGLPLIFVSHGGTAMAAALANMGLALNVSRYRVV